jgi:hypothetical protein
LEAYLDMLSAELEQRESSAPSETVRATLKLAKQSLDKAGRALLNKRDQVAWSRVHQATRFVIQALGDEEREAHRLALRREAEEKLSNWRRGAVADLLEGRAGRNPENLAFAQFLLHEHFGNVYFKLEVAAIRFKKLLWILPWPVVLLLALSFVFEKSSGGSFLNDQQRTSLVFLAGAAGALLSTTLSRLGLAGKIPAFLGDAQELLVRPFIGALSALAVCLIVESGLVPLGDSNPQALYGWAVAAGFSDQLVSFVMRRVESSAEK